MTRKQQQRLNVWSKNKISGEVVGWPERVSGREVERPLNKQEENNRLRRFGGTKSASGEVSNGRCAADSHVTLGSETRAARSVSHTHTHTQNAAHIRSGVEDGCSRAHAGNGAIGENVSPLGGGVRRALAARAADCASRRTLVPKTEKKRGGGGTSRT